jgi:hypothetical protein
MVVAAAVVVLGPQRYLPQQKITQLLSVAVALEAVPQTPLRRQVQAVQV